MSLSELLQVLDSAPLLSYHINTFMTALHQVTFYVIFLNVEDPSKLLYVVANPLQLI